jgi:ATP-binding cassette subfamily C protein LapB
VLVALAQWCRGRTLVVATHRPAALDLVDRIVVLEQGQVVLDGPRAEVLEQLARGVSLPAAPGSPAAASAPGEAVRVQG